MKKILTTVVMLFVIVGFTQAQTSTARVTTQKKELTKPVGSASGVTSTTKKSTNNKKTNIPAAPGPKVNATSIGKHKKAHYKTQKAVKKS